MQHYNNEVIYQIYPLTFNYASGSTTDPYPSGAYGNLKGITARVDYIKSLGVDTIWITPFYSSGGRGFGYDITDYCSIDPKYGNIDDFKELCEVFHGKGIKVIIDQVYNHCSIKHEWFKKSVERVAPYDKYFVWADPVMKNDKLSPPNNWKSIWDCLGESAWTFHPTREQYYLHSFDWSMPNLNLNNREVQDAILDVSKFWLDLGVDGFRLDAVTHYACDERLRDNPLYADGSQQRLYDIDSPNGAVFIERLKKLCDSYDIPKTLLAEYSYDKSPEGFAKAKKVFENSRCNAFFTGALNEHLGKFKQNIADELKVSPYGEKINWAFSNHDLERAASRIFGDRVSVQKTKMLMSLLLTLPGSVCIYQGEELGLPNPESIDKCKNKKNDPLDVWTVCNKPWDAGRAGFAMSDSREDSSRKLALHPAPIHYRYAVSRQRDAESMLNFTRQMIKDRKHSIFNEYGNVWFLDYHGDEVYPYVRTNQDGSIKILCIYNFSSYGAEVWYEGRRYYLEPESWLHQKV
ncbi:MAG: hypothetical protein IJ545_00520 [Alphaproteobacteria bacterium]|nr:hypothetical protein [Alphaproteobacteria bacterium]